MANLLHFQWKNPFLANGALPDIFDAQAFPEGRRFRFRMRRL